MTSIEQLHQEIVGLRKIMLRIQKELQAQNAVAVEDNEAGLELADDVVAEIATSRKRKRTEFITHEAVMKHYATE